MKKICAIAAVAGALLAAGPASAGWLGDQISSDDVYDFGSGWVYGGGWATATVPGSATSAGVFYHFTLTDHQLSVELPLGGAGFGSSPFIGVFFTDITKDALISNVALTGNTGTGAPVLSFDSNNIWLNFANMNTSSLQTFTYDVHFADDPASNAPEPVSWAMMVGGFAAVGAGMRASKRRSVRFA